MDSAALQQLAVKSANDYFSYLDERNRGRVEIGVKDARPSGECFLLLPMRRLATTDGLVFSLEGREYPAGAIRIESYDPEKNRLLLYLKPEQQAAFSACQPENILLISDLKFLITRYMRWMKAYGGHIRFNHSAPPFPFSCSFVPGRTPSPDQLQALQVAFTSPLSYIWGAPGTGKTQIVLAYGLLDYFRQERKVLLLAPTNNAVEQGLSGFLTLLQASLDNPEDFAEAAGRVLRLGNPSADFSRKYPRCCEVSGITAQISSLRNKVKNIEDCLTLRDFQVKAHLLKDDLIPAVDALALSANLLVEARVFERSIFTVIDSLKRQVSSQYDSLHGFEARLAALQEKEASLSGRIESVIKTPAADRRHKDIQYCIDCIDNLKQKISQLEDAILEKRQELGLFESRIRAEKDAFVTSVEDLRSKVVGIPKLTYLFKQLSPDNIFNIQSELCSLQKAADAYCSRKAHLAEEFEQTSSARLNEMRSEALRQIKALGQDSTIARIKDALVVGCTIDCFLNHFTVYNGQCAYEECVRFGTGEPPLYEYYPFYHAFLDEAGYCSLAKVMPLLCFSTPVTLLGDHMQLPPVCEASDEEIQTQAWESIGLWAQSAIYLEDLFSLDLRGLVSKYLENTPAVFDTLKRSDLTITYRFDYSLAQILDRHLYRIGFTGMPDKAPISIRYIDVPCPPGGKKRSNPGEARAICNSLNLFGEDFAILTPYRNQAGTIRTLLPPQRRDTVFTVHASQGREWDTVVLSVTDTSNMWFTDSQNPTSRGDKLMNTAISRTKKTLVLVCDTAFWHTQPDQLIYSLLEIAKPLYSAGTAISVNRFNIPVCT